MPSRDPVPVGMAMAVLVFTATGNPGHGGAHGVRDKSLHRPAGIGFRRHPGDDATSGHASSEALAEASGEDDDTVERVGSVVLAFRQRKLFRQVEPRDFGRLGIESRVNIVDQEAPRTAGVTRHGA